MVNCCKWCPNGCGKSVYCTNNHKKDRKYSCSRCNKTFSTEDLKMSGLN